MRGGVHLPARKSQPLAQPIGTATVPDLLTFEFENDSSMLVTPNSDVTLGQPIARTSTHIVHSSVSGRIVRVSNNSIEIANDHRDTRHADVRPISDFAHVAPDELRTRIENAGIVGLGGALFPTAAKLRGAADQRAQLLIINGAESEPFISCDEALMRERAEFIILGVQVLLRASEAERAIIAIENEKSDAIHAMSRAIDSSKDERIRLQLVSTRYPSGGERQLIETILRREVPSGGVPPDIGVLCQNVATAAAVGNLIREGEPLIGRIVTVTGSGVREPRNLYVRFGTSITGLIRDCGGYVNSIERLVIGGPMMGVTLESDQAFVGPAMNCLFVATKEDIQPRGVEMPCIRCGNCSDVCPAILLPQQLLRAARLRDRAALDELGLLDCIECGCCDYVCPSQIPLTSELHLARRLLS